MESRLTIGLMAALFLGACTSGSHVTGYHADDIYFNPGDVPPPISANKAQDDRGATTKSSGRMIISNIEENQEGSRTMNNYIFDGTEQDADALTYSMNQYDLYSSDTTVYYNDDDVKYVINNYYDGEAVDYAYRIRRFHRPHFYDPFYWDSWYYDPYYYDPFLYSSWYYPSMSLSWRWGWGGGWHSPYYSWGWGYSPYRHWYHPHYAWYGGYYGGYYGGGYYGGYPYWSGSPRYDSDNYRYGQRRSTGSGVVYGDNSARRQTTSSVRSSTTTTRSASPGSNGVVTDSRRNSSVSGVRDGSQPNAVRREVSNNNVITERRRADNGGQGVRTSSESNIRSQTYTRPGNTSVQSYTRPSTGVTTSPRVITQSKSAGSSYTDPGSSPSYNRTYRSSSTYNRGSSSTSPVYRQPSSTSSGSGSGRTYQSSTPPRSNSGSNSSGSYSAPSRSYSTPSSSGSSSGSSYGGSSGGSSRSAGSSSGRR